MAQKASPTAEMRLEKPVYAREFGNRSSAPKSGLNKDDRSSWATRLYCLCAPAIVAGVLLVIWNRMLPQLLRGHLEKIVLS